MTMRSAIAALTAVGACSLAAAAPAGAASGSFGCSASALSGTVLGQKIDPLAAVASGPCTTKDASTALPALLGSAPVVAKTNLLDGRATSIAGVGDVKVGGTEALTSLLPTADIPSNLSALPIALPTVPLTGTGTGGGLLGGVTGTVTGSLLPSSMTVDLVDAVKALIPQLPVPDLLSLTGVQSTATGACVGGTPALDGNTTIAALKVLGQDLGTDRAIDQALTVSPAKSISLDAIDLSLVKLPAGLSLDDPILGPILTTALQTTLASLPPIEIPALIGNVRVTPASQERSGDTLIQRALSVQVDVLGQRLVDLGLGEARVSSAGVDCGTPSVAPASQLAVECAKRPVTLVDVAEKKDYVSLLGAVSAENVGRTVAIVSRWDGKTVATGVVRPDGFFRAKAPLPAESIRSSNDTRYQAVLDGHKSLALKLQRRMRISRMRNLGDSIQIIGKITGPLVPGQEIVIRRRESCTKDVIVKRFTPQHAGAWRVTLPAPNEGQAAVYRATTQVFGADEGEKRFPTFTLPGYVSL